MLSGPPVSGTVGAAELLERFLAGSPRQRRSLLPQFETRAAEILPLIAERLERLDSAGDDWAAGFLIQLLHACGEEGQRVAFLARHPTGWLDAPSAA